MEKFSYLKPINAEYIEDLYHQYLQDPDSVDETWRYFFEGIELGEANAAERAEEGNGNGHHVVSASGAGQLTAVPATTAPVVEFPLSKEAKVLDLIQAYRQRGHLLANVNPLQDAPTGHPLLDLKNFGLTESDLDSRFRASRLLGFPDMPLRDILAFLRETYCGSIGVEYTHMTEAEHLGWLQTAMETSRNRPNLDKPEKMRAFKKLAQAELFENYLHTRYIAQKRFSVEGGDAIIPALDTTIEEVGASGGTDIVMGMAHRGRLNVLTHIFGKKYEVMFNEFDGNYAYAKNPPGVPDAEGDVKYHKGYSADVVTSSGQSVHLSLLANPSHLEAVNPVVEGVARAKQTLKGDEKRSKVVPVLIHGDAAFAGQGLIYETLQLSKLKGFATGGTLHFIINNQVGFTTNPSDARSTPYASDIMKMLESPVFHVNGDDVEAVIHVTKLAVRYLQAFNCDVVIDLICYRKYGHNEGDEPSFTQPAMYRKIKEHKTPRVLYGQKLVQSGVAADGEVQAIVDEINARLTEAHQRSKTAPPEGAVSVFEGEWKGLRRAADQDLFVPAKTAVSEAVLKEVGVALATTPADFHVHPKLQRLLDGRRKMVTDGTNIDWGMGESLAYATLLVEGKRVRITGQDVERGTFTHRHAVLNDFENGQKYCTLNNLRPGKQAQMEIYNSNLAEQAVLGFEFGYASADPHALVIWEAQFGDFANGAQIIIDQFLAASESKWARSNGLVMLLPHGYEGQGPEHSSARLERFLQLCGKNNMQVCNLSTPAQIFHALRRQLHRDYRIPLVVMSPKSLLRHPEAVSSLSDFSDGRFFEVIGETAKLEAKKVSRMLICSGKVYYELKAEREKLGRGDVAIVRLEQMYPFPAEALKAEFAKYSGLKEVVWVQEEPRNMGAWRSIMESLQDVLGKGMSLRYCGRDVAAAPAVGSPKVHEKEQRGLIEGAFKV